MFLLWLELLSEEHLTAVCQNVQIQRDRLLRYPNITKGLQSTTQKIPPYSPSCTLLCLRSSVARRKASGCGRFFLRCRDRACTSSPLLNACSNAVSVTRYSPLG